MGNLFSLKLDAPRPSRPSYHKRSQRGPSVSSSNAGLSATCGISDSSMPVSVSRDSAGLRRATSTVAIADQNGSASTVSSKLRRSSLKMTLKRAYSSASASSNVFTDERRQIVQATWKAITDEMGKLGASLAIFRLLFQACPALKRTFGVEAVDDLETCDHFARHARVFGNVLDLTVRNALELETEVGPVLIVFGRRHFYKHQLDFRNEYLTLFAQSISDFVAAHLSDSYANNPEATAAWRLLISYMIHKVKEGFDLEYMQARKHSAPQ